MRTIMLLWPHANARYQAETLKLAQAELRLMLDRAAPGATIAPAGLDMPSLAVDFDGAPPDAAVAAIRRHSLLYGLFEDRDGLLAPVAGRYPARVGGDLPAILKYKGKTNEMFLQLLLNAALYSGDYWDRANEPLKLLDPMCGRATAVFVAANMGWDATGADVDRNDLKEAENYFKRYLEYHRFKHALTKESRTLPGGRSAAVSRFEYAADAQSFKDAPREIRLACLDAAQAEAAFGKNAFHIIACDLPYGVRHDAQLSRGADRRGNWLETLLRRALPGWKAALKPGGTVAVSFNAQNFPPERLRALMADAGLEPVETGGEFTHWVEQAITRDIAIARKPR